VDRGDGRHLNRHLLQPAVAGPFGAIVGGLVAAAIDSE